MNNNQQSSEESAAISGGNPLSPSTGSGGNQWSAAVGRANLGKSGRVIEKLMGENDKLKREINTEKTRAEDFRQAAKMIEGRMDAMAQEYDKKLHDAAINKAQLKKRERQLNEARALIDGAKAKAEKALEREQGWKAEMERIEEESKRKVEEAQTYAALMEGRNNAMTSHWKEQGAEVDRTVSKLGKEIDILVVDRRKDDERMNTLQGLCDQQAEQLEDLQKEKQAIQDAFQAYKREQAEGLKAIKDRARAQEAANERAIQETHKVLGELKWALGVKANVKGAQ
jgi:chromosome segregation ATPase